jgi:hypothetical protein
MNRIIIGSHFKEIVFGTLPGGPCPPVVDQLCADTAATKLWVDREQ